ncbi:MAG TPA: TraR/DksA family transcriptional regulator [Bryobacteraceae bacterium]|nr:TraR/DksA family transcriptional regulator [Bryobacteraceae bacterium]
MKKGKEPEPAMRPAVYKKVLIQKREQVMAGLGIKFDTLAKMGRVAEEDQAQLSHDEFISLRLNSLDYVQLRMIEEALDRIEAGDYGVCLGCEEPIPGKRLQAVPWAKYCVTCQQEMSNPHDDASSSAKPRVGVQENW